MNKKDFATAMKELTPLAQQGNADAQIFLCKMYMSGQGVPKDADLAVKWFKAAADEGNAEGQFFLGAMYLLPVPASRKGHPSGIEVVEAFPRSRECQMPSCSSEWHT